MITEEFKKILDADILLIESNESRNANDGQSPTFFELYARILAKYKKIINGFGSNMITNHEAWAYKRNLITLKEQMILFKAMGYENINESNENDNQFQVAIHNTNTNTNNINLSFDDVKKDVENMSALTNKEIEEILEKIEVLEKIIGSNNRKAKKWEDAKEIIKWVAEKGVDVGLTLLPLLLKIQ